MRVFNGMVGDCSSIYVISFLDYENMEEITLKPEFPPEEKRPSTAWEGSLGIHLFSGRYFTLSRSGAVAIMNLG